MPGCSGTPLPRKLGIASGMRVHPRRSPVPYEELVSPLPDGVELLRRLTSDLDMVHVFTRRRRELARELPMLLARIRVDGAIWVSWPKRSSGEATDVTEDVVRAEALPLGLVDVKVCAVDETWSALRLVIRRERRGSRRPGR